MTNFISCSGCGGPAVDFYQVPSQPAILNYRFTSEEQAATLARVDLNLACCKQCGLVFNRSFDAELVPYDTNYDNSQACSPAFHRYLSELAQQWVDDYHLHHSELLEVGCGKGAFLQLICRQAGAQGTGYDTTYEGPATLEDPSIRFFDRYVHPADVDRVYKGLICRHVIEHVGPIGVFLASLAAIARSSGAPFVFLETPAFEWIMENRSFWDIFHEHCNYFRLPTLAHLCQLAGLEVLEQNTVFGGQYQVLVARLAQSSADSTPTPITPLDMRGFARQLKQSREDLEHELRSSDCGSGWAVWGAGAKGVALVNTLQLNPPTCVIDLNRAKQGGVVPGSRVPIVSPDFSGLNKISVILIANPNYQAEIKSILKERNYQGKILLA